MSEAESYVAKWLAREPEMELALVFCPPAQRPLFRLWGALLHELDAALFDVGDRSVAQTKLAWWGDELGRGAQASARHPLVREFCAQEAAQRIGSAQWMTLAFAAMRMADDDNSPPDLAASLNRHRPYCEALAQIESTLFEAATPVDALVINQLLRQISSTATDKPESTVRWPLQLLARHQLAVGAASGSSRSAATAGLVKDYASQLLPVLRRAEGGSLLRRCRSALDEAQLRRLASGERDVRAGRLSSLWRIWRAARGVGSRLVDSPSFRPQL